MANAVSNSVEAAAKRARAASLVLADLSAATRNAALLAVADAYEKRRADILLENARDIEEGEQLCSQGKLTKASLKRLQLAGDKFDAAVKGLRAVAALPDPIGQVQRRTELDEGLILERVSCPIGVICTIFESRPDALPQIVSLCLKSGNAVLLKGGSEARRSNRILADIFRDASVAAGAPEGWLHLLETREDVSGILRLDPYIDLIIPRGGNELVRAIMDNTKIPVTGHRDGICHVYIHAAADPAMARKIAVDSKCQYPAVCNAAETILLDESFAVRELPALAKALVDRGVRLRGCERTRQILRGSGLTVEEATEDDWRTEYLDLIVSIRVVAGLDEAIDHINTYGSHHTDSIVTEDAAAADTFLSRIDSASVMHNVSTRFSDGYRYGLGAEVGISANKIHSRGPVGLEGLAIYKYILRGRGQAVAEYMGDNARPFTHRPLPV